MLRYQIVIFSNIVKETAFKYIDSQRKYTDTWGKTGLWNTLLVTDDRTPSRREKNVSNFEFFIVGNFFCLAPDYIIIIIFSYLCILPLLLLLYYSMSV